MRADKMPLLNDILGGRARAMEKGGGNVTETGKYPFFFFCNTVLECVAGRKEWKKEKAKLLVSESSVTVSDEAFALLLMVNSWDKFEYLAESDGEPNKDDTPTTVYTEKKGRNKKLQGWTTQGINHFNQLCKFVATDRESEAGIEFEKEFLRYQQNEMVRKKAALGASGNDEQGDENCGCQSPNRGQAWNQLSELVALNNRNVVSGSTNQAAV
jgi:hypothetical protein